MKQLLIAWVMLLTLMISKNNGAQTGRSIADSVYICVSARAYAFHDHLCSGLKNCTHEIRKVELKYARETLNKKACKNCYK
jgi:hypothetical protein